MNYTLSDELKICEFCYICDTKLNGVGDKLINLYTSTSKRSFPLVISTLIGDDFLLLVGKSDAVCCSCVSLLNNMDKLEQEVRLLKKTLLTFLVNKYDLCLNEISSSDSKNAVEFPNETNIISVDHDKVLSVVENATMCRLYPDKILNDEANLEMSSQDREKDSNINTLSCEGPKSLSNEKNSEVINKKLPGNLSDNSIYFCEVCNELISSAEELFNHSEHHCTDHSGVSGSSYSGSTLHKSGSTIANTDNPLLVSNHASPLSENISLELVNVDKDVHTDKKITTRVQVKDNFKSDQINNNFNGSAFVCHLCDFNSNSKSSYIKHYKEHLKYTSLHLGSPKESNDQSDPDMSCKICLEQFCSSEELMIHYRIHNNNVCDKCGKDFPSELKLKEHIVVHEAKIEVNQCEFCLERFDSYNNLETHCLNSNHTIKGTKNCPICGKKSSTGFAVKRHVLKVHVVPSLQQEIRKNYASGSDLISKMKNAGASETLIKSISCSKNYSEQSIGISNPPLLACNVCGFVTKDLNIIIKHENIHLANNVLCSMCSKSFPGENELSIHLVSFHKLTLGPSFCIHCLKQVPQDFYEHLRSNHGSMYSHLVCYLCKQIYFNKSDLIEHVKNHLLDTSDESSSIMRVNNATLSNSEIVQSNECIEDIELSEALNTIQCANICAETIVKYKCGECGLIGDQEEIEKHFESHNIECPICHETFSSEDKLQEHSVVHTNKGNAFPCSYCSEIFSSKEILLEHTNKNHQNVESILFCKPCCKYFSLRSMYLRHISTKHTVNKNCSTCGKNFTNLNNFIFHRDYMHRSDLSCQFCSKQCKDPFRLKKHESLHKRLKKKTHVCKECNKEFKSLRGLKMHSVTHTGIYPFVCEYCGKGFHSNYALSEHGATHSGDIRYCCEICGRSFRLYDTYHRHRKQHDNPYPSKCLVCGERFRSASRLAEHKRKRHTGERPYLCPYCPATFNVSSSYKVHLCLHTKIFPHNCTKCGKGFTTRMSCANHMASKHKDFFLLQTAKRRKPVSQSLQISEVENT